MKKSFYLLFLLSGSLWANDMRTAGEHDLKYQYQRKTKRIITKEKELLSEDDLNALFSDSENDRAQRPKKIKLTVYNYYLDEFSRSALEKSENFIKKYSDKFDLEAKLVINIYEFEGIKNSINNKGVGPKERRFLKRFDHGYKYKVFGIADECKTLGIKRFPSFVFDIPKLEKKYIIAGRDVDLDEIAKKLKLISK